jgi:hypothetical protein
MSRDYGRYILDTPQPGAIQVADARDPLTIDVQRTAILGDPRQLHGHL